MTEIKTYGMYIKLNPINTYEELILFIQNLPSIGGFSTKHMKYLAETKDFIRVLVDEGFTLGDIRYSLIHKTYPQHQFCPICKIIELHSNGRVYPKTCCSKKCQYTLMEQTLTDTYLKIYGVTNPFKDPRVQEQCKQTKLEKYGTLSPMPYLSCALLEKYGVSCTFDIPGVREKSTQTMLERYGVEQALASPEIFNKGKQTKLERYGDENYNNPKKCKQTKLERYRDENYNNIEKIKQTFIKHYGVDNNMKSSEGLSVYCESIRNKYGTDFVFQSSYFKNKTQETCLNKFGVKHQMQSPEIQKKMRAKYTYNDEKFDSSWELAFWIYCNDHNIQIEHEPLQLDYVDDKGVNRKYYPDFRVNDQLIEIKGDDQFDENGKMIDKLNHDRDYIAESKHQCMIANNVKIIMKNDIQRYLDYIDSKYGKNYLQQFKNTKNNI